MDHQEEISELRSGKHIYKILFFCTLTLLILILGFGGYYYLKSNKVTKVKNLNPTPTPSSDSAPVADNEESLVKIGKNTISFTRINTDVILRYEDKYYVEGVYAAETQSFSDKSVKWYGLIDGPSHGVEGFYDILSIRKFPDNRIFAFVTRWDNLVERDSQTFSQWILKIFYYNPYLPIKLTEIYSAEQKRNEHPYIIPIIDKISPDGKYMSLKMHGCWNCGGGNTETMLMNISTKDTRRIGETSYFEWQNNGEYSYKEYKETSCQLEGPGRCPPDETVQIKTGRMN